MHNAREVSPIAFLVTMVWFFRRVDAPDEPATVGAKHDFWVIPGQHTLGRAANGVAAIRVHAQSVSKKHGVLTCKGCDSVHGPNDASNRPALSFEGDACSKHCFGI